MLLAAIAAFVPVMGVDYLLDSYVRVREKAQLQQAATNVADRLQSAAFETIGSLRRILAGSPSLCTPTFVAVAHREMESSLYLKQVLVENGNNVQYCDGFGREVKYSALSPTLPIPGHTESVAVVQLGELAMPALKVTQAFGQGRQVSAFSPILSNPAATLLNGLKPTGMLRIVLTSGPTVLTAGDPTPFDKTRSDTEFISVEAYAGELPLRVEAAVPFAIVRADYADLDASFTLIACLMSGAFFVLALQYVRRSNLPAFDLERAIAENEIKPYYQPVINLKSGALAGCEVLCRWEKKSGEVVPPAAFIEYAEVTGLAIPMTLKLMEQTRQDLSELCKRMPELKISINLFHGHFLDNTIVEDVRAIFEGSPISYRQLVFEITERQPLGASMQTLSVIAGLHALGCRVAMDDAGTGYSNLAYLQTLGVDIVEIDQVFVNMIKSNGEGLPVLDGLIGMAQELGTEIVAEGVETETQALYLRARGVIMAQGFLFAPALRAPAFKELANALNGPTTQVPAAAAA